VNWRVLQGDTRDGLRSMPEKSVHTCVTSPPYWGLRDYGVDGQIGLEQTPAAYVAAMVEVFREVRRVLRDDGTCWVNLGDSYAAGKAGRTDDGCDDPTSTLGPSRRGLPNNSSMGPVVPRKPPPGFKPKDLVGIPWRVAFALQADGWYLRQDIIWAKPNPRPESVTDRCTKSHEYLFLLSKNARYYYDAAAIAEDAISAGEDRGGGLKYSDRTKDNGIGGAHNLDKFGATGQTRNRRSVWTIATQPFPEAHFATFPEALVEPCIKAGSPVGGLVLDPFSGSGTTGVVALKQGRSYVGCELNPEYVQMSRRRLANVAPLLAREVA
jgi:DNA modification methylase